MRRVARCDFPLIHKEWLEQSGEPFPYAARAVTAAVAFGWLLANVWLTGGNWGSLVGSGPALFVPVARSLLLGAMVVELLNTAPAFVEERQRRTLPLLLVTRMSALRIVFEKLIARSTPAFSLVFAVLPAAAVAFSAGGMQLGDVLMPMLAGGLLVLRAGATGILASTLCRGTFAAVVLAVTLVVLLDVSVSQPFVSLAWLDASVWRASAVAGSSWPRPTPVAAGSPVGVARLVAIAGPDILWKCFAAALFLQRPQRESRESGLLRVFQRLDAWFDRWNARLAGGVVLVADEEPDDDPLRWVEARVRLTGRVRHMVRVLLLVEISALVLAVALDLLQELGEPHAFLSMFAVVWSAVCLVVLQQAGDAIHSERERRTMDLLRVLPRSGFDILRAKAAALRWPMLCATVPAATMVAMAVLSAPQVSVGQVFRLLLALLSAGALLYLLQWLAIWRALRCPRRWRASLEALALFFAVLSVAALACRYLWLPQHGPSLGAIVVESVWIVATAPLLPGVVMIGTAAGDAGLVATFGEIAHTGSVMVRSMDIGHVLRALLSPGALIAAVFLAGLLIRWHVLRRADVLLDRVPVGVCDGARPIALPRSTPEDSPGGTAERSPFGVR